MLAILGGIVLRNVFVSAHRVLGWAVAAIVLAVLLDPLVRLVRHIVPRPIAVLLALTLAAAIVMGVTYGVFADLNTEVERIKDEAPAAAAEIEERDDRLGEIARDLRLQDRVEAFLDSLDERVGTGGQALRSAVGSVPTYVVGAVLTIFVYLYGPRIVEGGLAQVSDLRRRRRLSSMLGDATRRSQGYVLAALAQSVVVFALAWLAGRSLDVPAPIVLALIAAVVALLPYVGVLLGALPLLVLGLASAPGIQVAFVAVTAVALQVIEALWVRSAVDRRTLHVGPAIPLVVGLIGFEVYGVGGALYGSAIAVFLLALADSAATDDPGGPEEIPTPVDEWSEDAAPA
jgi:predicted PurR-regulated permease PerM